MDPRPVRITHDFFEGLPAEVQADFERASSIRRVARGGAVMDAGEKRGTVYQILEGRVKYSSFDARGRETVAAVMARGDWIGLSEVFTGMPAMSHVIALTPLRLRSIAQRDFEALIERHPAAAMQLLRLFSLRFSLMYRIIQDRSERMPREQLIKTLCALSHRPDESGGTPDDVVIEISQEELAKLMALSRQTVNRLLGALEREGLVALSYHRIRIASRAAIERRYPDLFLSNEPIIGRN